MPGERRRSSNKKLTETKRSPSKQIEKFELSVKQDEHYTPISTTRILSKFTRDPPPEVSALEQQHNHAVLQQHADVVAALRKWARHREKNTAIKFLLRTVFWKSVKVRIPTGPKLDHAINHFFPTRPDIKVIVCDFGEGRAERQEVRLGDIEAEFREKPSWSTVRWMWDAPFLQSEILRLTVCRHAPLGVGLLHSSVEALFFHTGSKTMGRPFTRGGRAGWPYLELETLDFRKASSVRDSRDMLRILASEEQVSDALDRSLWVGDNNENLKKDVTWRAQFVGKPLDFWGLAEADLPSQISEGSHMNMNGPADGIRTTDLEQSAQSLTRNAFFKDAYLARSPFRTFHRDDGFLLTMSPAAGVDYLNTNFQHYITESRDYLHEDNFASAIAEVYREFSESGTDTWHRKTVEWFLVYLITEAGATPHNIRQGYSVPSLMDAYDSIVHELKQRRYDRWQRNETINLVRAYLVCIDELTILEAIFTKKLDFFQRLKKDVEAFEASDVATGSVPDNKDGETPADRVSFAEHVMEESAMQCKRLNSDLRESMNSLFQLRSIEQNELAIIADTQNKSLFVFTAVTIVFLPLSFFTSYFGMNLKGIQNTEKTERYFWKVCGPVAIGLVLLISLYAFRHLMKRRMSAFRVGAEVHSV